MGDEQQMDYFDTGCSNSIAFLIQLSRRIVQRKLLLVKKNAAVDGDIHIQLGQSGASGRDVSSHRSRYKARRVRNRKDANAFIGKLPSDLDASPRTPNPSGKPHGCDSDEDHERSQTETPDVASSDSHERAARSSHCCGTRSIVRDNSEVVRKFRASISTVGRGSSGTRRVSLLPILRPKVDHRCTSFVRPLYDASSWADD